MTDRRLTSLAAKISEAKFRAEAKQDAYVENLQRKYQRIVKRMVIALGIPCSSVANDFNFDSGNEWDYTHDNHTLAARAAMSELREFTNYLCDDLHLTLNFDYFGGDEFEWLGEYCNKFA